MMNFCIFVIFITSIFLYSQANEPRIEFIHFWEEYKKYDLTGGRSCGECHFPMIINNTKIYGCISRKDEKESLMCKSSYDRPMDCDPSCPDGRPAVPNVYIAYTTPNQDILTMQCSTFGSPNPSIKWIKNGEQEVEHYKPLQSEMPEWVISYLRLPFSEDSRGVYSCIADNGHAQSISERKAFFSGSASTAAPKDVRVVNQTGTTLTVEWDYEGEVNMHVSYLVKLSVREDEDEGEEENGDSKDQLLPFLHGQIPFKTYDNSFTKKYLIPGLTYEVVVWANDYFGYGPSSEALEVTISENATREAILNVTAVDITETSITLQWSYTGDPGLGMHFTVKVFPYVYENLVIDYDDWNENYTITSLESYKDYEIIIGAQNEDGLDIESEMVSIKTKPTEPEVTSLEIKNDNPDKIKIVCRIRGTPAPNVTVTKDGGDIPSSADLEVKQGSSSTKVTLVLNRSFIYYGHYNFEGRNLAGNADETIHVTYQGKHPETLAEMMLYVIENIQAMQKDNEENMKDLKKELEEIREKMEELASQKEEE